MGLSWWEKKRDEGWTCHVIKCNVFPIPGLNGSGPVLLLFLSSTGPAAGHCRTRSPWRTRERGGLEICVEKMRLYFVWVFEK